MSEKLRTAPPPHPENNVGLEPLTAEQSDDFKLWEQEMAVGEAQDTLPLDAADVTPQDNELPYSAAVPTPETTPIETAENTVETPAPVVAEAEVTKQEIAALPDAEIRYKDAEILGRNYPVRQFVHETGVQYTKAIESTKANWKNALDTPGLATRKFSQYFAQKSRDKKLERLKLERADLDAMPEGRLKNLRQKKFARNQAKFRRAHDKMLRANQAVTDRTSRMEGRTKAVHENAEKRRAEYISELKNKREQALARRTMRRELRAQGASLFERNAIVKDIPKEHLTRVGKLAAQAEVSKRVAGRAERTEAKSRQQEIKIVNAIENNGKLAEQHDEEAAHAEQTLAEIQGTNLPEANQHVEALQAHLAELEQDNPNRTQLLTQIDEAKQKVAILEQREIPYWQSVAASNKARAEQLRAEVTTLQTKQQEQAQATMHARVDTYQQQFVSGSDRNATKQAAQEALKN